MIRLVRGWLSDLRGRAPYRRYGERRDRGRRLRAQICTGLAVVATIVYLSWLAGALNLDAWWLSIPFLLAEIVALAVFCGYAAVAWYPRYHRPDSDAGRLMATVDVVITACGEPYELVADTVRAAVAIDWSNKMVTLLDDGHDPRLRTLCADVGCIYLARAERAGAKAGNLNYGLGLTDGELILVLDADQVPDPAIIRRLVGYFRNPRVAFVQTRQHFRLPDGDPFGNSDPIFYGLMQLGKDSVNAAFSCGSGVMYRRRALHEVGGFSTWNLVEDVHTSMLLHARGWRSVYHNHALTSGTAPLDIWAAYRQRQQWAVDSLRILFWDSPLRRTGLSLPQRLQYAHIGVVYLFAGFVMPFFYLVPLLSLFTGVHVLGVTLWSYVMFRFPSFLLTTLSYRYYYQSVETPLSFTRATNIWLGYFPAFIRATWVALCSRRRPPAYAVTPKSTRSARTPLLATAPQWLLIVLSVVAIPYGVVNRTGSWDLLAINSAWALWTVEKLVWICRAVHAVRRTEPATTAAPPPQAARAA